MAQSWRGARIAAIRERMGRRPGLLLYLLLALAIPGTGMVTLAGMQALDAADRRDAAAALDDEALELVGIIEARAALTEEEAHSSVVAVAADLGASVAQLEALYGVDYVDLLGRARAAVDRDALLSRDAALEQPMDRLRELRQQVDSGEAGFDDVRSANVVLDAALSEMWDSALASAKASIESSQFRGSVHARLDAVQASFRMLGDGAQRALLGISVVLPGSRPDDVEGFLAATYRFDSVVADLPASMGPQAAEAWERHASAAATVSFEETLEGVRTSALRGQPSPLASDPDAFGQAFVDGAMWGTGLADTVRAAGRDLREAALDEADRAGDALRSHLLTAMLLTALSVAVAWVMARRIVAPVERLQRAAQSIHAGQFDLEPMPAEGPRELVETSTAFNDMASTLSAVEAHAVALADDPDAPVLSDRLPGRTGRALQVALNRVRASIQVAERRRQELQEAASHDPLTGLLNRSAAFEMIARDLNRVSREGGGVMALFVDLDGLKPINDEHGHAAGDDALRLTAEALLDATRASDMVARIGGDEFLVAGVVAEGDDEVADLAERVRQAVAERSVRGHHGAVPIRCSVGMAVATAGATVESLLSEADAALYEAKRRGRDQVAWLRNR